MPATRKAACVIGWPVAHSRSPLIHGYWIRRYGLDAEYRREAVPPEKFEAFVTRLAEHGYVGANVTIPNKEAALRLSQADARARRVGAAPGAYPAAAHSSHGLSCALLLSNRRRVRPLRAACAGAPSRPPAC